MATALRPSCQDLQLGTSYLVCDAASRGFFRLLPGSLSFSTTLRSRLGLSGTLHVALSQTATKIATASLGLLRTCRCSSEQEPNCSDLRKNSIA